MLLINCGCSFPRWDIGWIQDDLRQFLLCFAAMRRGEGLKSGCTSRTLRNLMVLHHLRTQTTTEGTIMNLQTIHQSPTQGSACAFCVTNTMSALRRCNSVSASPIWWTIHNDLPLNIPRSHISTFIGFILNHRGYLFMSAEAMTELFDEEN